MSTCLYLVPHGTTDEDLSNSHRLQGRQQDPPLSHVGIRQARLTRDLLAIRAIDACYSSPMRRATQTANIIAAPHERPIQPVADLTECDTGHWEGLDLEAIGKFEEADYRRFLADPGNFPFPGGESFAAVRRRASAAITDISRKHPGGAVLVVSHTVVLRLFLAGVLGMGLVSSLQLDSCGISLVEHDGQHGTLVTLNATFHVQGADSHCDDRFAATR